jgi:hypothetical protein
MKTSLLFVSLALAAPAFAKSEKVEPPVPVTPAPPAEPATTETYSYSQKLYGTSEAIIAPDRARQVVDNFRVAYDKLGKPRVLIYVNRALVEEQGGLRLTGRREQTESTRTESKSSFEVDPNAPKSPSAGNPQTQVNVAVGGGSAGSSADANTPGRGTGESRTGKVTAENTYSSTERPASTLADQQTVRDVERLLGRPFRYAGATLADQKVATALLADKPLDHFTAPTDDAARKDREALTKIADVVIEVLISSRSMNVAEVSGDKTVAVPDIQATAIRLSDSAIIGQASASDILGKNEQASRIARLHDVRDITEATALALMEDITVTTK